MKPIKITSWFWFYKRRVWGGFVVGFYKIFTIWFMKNGFEFTISHPSYKEILFWWIKIDIYWNPFDFCIFKQRRIE